MTVCNTLITIIKLFLCVINDTSVCRIIELYIALLCQFLFSLCRRCTKQLILRVTLLDLQVAGLQGCASTLGPKSFWRGRDSNPGLLLSWQALYQLSYWPPRQKWVPAHLTNASKSPPASQISPQLLSTVLWLSSPRIIESHWAVVV